MMTMKALLKGGQNNGRKILLTKEAFTLRVAVPNSADLQMRPLRRLVRSDVLARRLRVD
jgi:hypothetical protein